MKGSVILLEANPRGKFQEGIIDDTSKPGTAMQLTLGGANSNGRAHYEHYQPSADGDPRATCILLEDRMQGSNPFTAYVAGTRCFLYFPLPGEEINVLVRGQVGTGSANAFTVGERLIAGHTDGKFIQEATSATAAMFSVMEHIDEVPDADTLVWCRKE